MRTAGMPEHCRNTECPFWEADADESCGKPTAPHEGWIKEFCDKQPSEEEVQDA